MQTPETRARPENPNPKWPVPKDLIELQPSYKQDDWDPDWQSTTSSKVAYLVNKLRSLKAENIKHGYSRNMANGACLSSQSSCQDHNNVEGRLPHTMPDKVIIFSQFLEHIHVIEQQVNLKWSYCVYLRM
jgi:SNF2 family DNA or RNA helicase